MKQTIALRGGIICIFAALAFGGPGCKPSKPDQEEIKTAVEEVKNEVKVAVSEVKETIQETSEKEWKLMIDEMEQKIREDEKTMEKLKAKMKVTGQKLDSYYLRQIEQLEEKFNTLQERMKKSDKRKADWKAYKDEFDRDMLKMKEALKKVAE